MAHTLDSLCQLQSQPIGCVITVVAQGFTPGETVTFLFGPTTNGVGSISVGSALADMNGDAAQGRTSALATTDYWFAEAPSGNTFGIGYVLTWTSPSGTCFDPVTDPVLDTTVDGRDVTLDWTPASDCDPRFGSTITYDVKREGSTIASGLSGFTYTDNNVPAGEYDYQIVAVWSTTFLGGLTTNSNIESIEILTLAVSFDSVFIPLGS